VRGSGARCARLTRASRSCARPYDLTVEQLAAAVGMSVRNIRNHHSRGLLPPPQVRARVGYYSADHVARLRLILDLQADGFNLTAIERLLSGSDGLAQRLLGLRTAVIAPFEPETPDVVTGQELTERFGEVDAKDAARVRRLKLLIPLGDDRCGRLEPFSDEGLERAIKRVSERVALDVSEHEVVLHGACNACAA
jgi:DNA-binding transcriptional MerR regulator